VHQVEQDADAATPVQASLKECVDPAERAGDDGDPVTWLQARTTRIIDGLAGAETHSFDQHIGQDGRRSRAR